MILRRGAALLWSIVALGVVSRFAAGVGADQLSPTAADLRAQFERRVADIASHVDGVVGYEILDLTSGDRIGRLETASFPTAALWPSSESRCPGTPSSKSSISTGRG